MDIEKIMLDVQKEFGSGGLTDGLSGDFAREVAKRAIAAEREECATLCEKRADPQTGAEGMFTKLGWQCAKVIRERV
jgi:hypothetical protein